MLRVHELVILFKKLPKDELAEAIKRTAGHVFQKGGFFRRIEYLGFHKTPFRLTKDKNPYKEANYVFYEFNIPRHLTRDVCNEMLKDRAVIRKQIFSLPFPEELIDYDQCTFEDEMKPVPYRPEVIKLVKLAKDVEKKKTKQILKWNTNCDFLPFDK